MKLTHADDAGITIELTNAEARRLALAILEASQDARDSRTADELVSVATILDAGADISDTYRGVGIRQINAAA